MHESSHSQTLRKSHPHAQIRALSEGTANDSGAAEEGEEASYINAVEQEARCEGIRSAAGQEGSNQAKGDQQFGSEEV
jgi:hypothetical protein